MRSLPHLGLLVWLSGLTGPAASGDVLPPQPEGPRVLHPPALADGPLRDRLPVAGSITRPALDFGWIPPWAGTIARVEDDPVSRPLAFASFDCGLVRPEADTRKPVVPKSFMGRTFGEMNWLILGLFAATVGLGSLAAEMARPPRFGLVPYGRAVRRVPGSGGLRS